MINKTIHSRIHRKASTKDHLNILGIFLTICDKEDEKLRIEIRGKHSPAHYFYGFFLDLSIRFFYISQGYEKNGTKALRTIFWV
jgi:hypothetical protein